MTWPEVWHGKSAGAALCRTALLPASWLYAAGWECYLLAYRYGLRESAQPHSPIVVVGNLAVGGSGKTPFVRYVSRLLREMGRSVVVSCSGYGSPRSEAATWAPEGRLDPAEWGDEPALLRMLEPDLPLIVGRRRVLAAQICHEKAPESVLLLDDGFQHLPLQKDLSILLHPDQGNHLCLPAGPLRESWKNRNRADLVIPGQFVVRERSILKTTDGDSLPPGELQALTAIGWPRAFLASLPTKPQKKLVLPDHDPLNKPSLLSGFDPGIPIATTTKDWVKLRERPDVSHYTWLISEHEVWVEPEDEFRAWLKERLR